MLSITDGFRCGKHRQQAGCQVLLPIRCRPCFTAPEIPLSAGSGNRVQITELQYVFDNEERIGGLKSVFSPAVRGMATESVARARCESSISAFTPAPRPAR